MESKPAGLAWIELLKNIRFNGEFSSPRGFRTQEILCCKSVIPINECLVNIPGRRLGHKFLCAEAAWIMSGDNRVETIAPFSSQISEFSDDGIRYFGAYGPRIVDQLRHVVSSLAADWDSRQGVISIWRANPPKSKDIPCTISAQWMIRENKLHCFVNMRSSDAWLGVPYDWFNFCMITVGILAELNTKTNWELTPGNLYFNAASQHLYVRNFEAVDNIIGDKSLDGPSLPWSYSQLNACEFKSYQDVVDHLWNLAHGRELNRSWLHELRKDVKDAQTPD